VQTPPVPAQAPRTLPAVGAGSGSDSGTETSLTTFSDDGAVVELDDGTVWSIDGGDQGTVSGWSDGDTINVSPSGDSLTDYDTGDNVSATQIGDMTDQNTYANTGDNTLAATGDDGSIVTLADGSVWAINASDQATISSWTDSDNIVVNDNSDGSYQLVDTDDQSAVSANYIGAE
jgi:hypothetical protein